MSSVSSSAADRNVEVLRAGERIEKLTMATDALVARHFILTQKDEILDDLERYVTALEAEVAETEAATADIRKRCALLRPSTRPAVSGEDAEVSRLWHEYGATMTRLVAKHSARLVSIEESLAAQADLDDAEPVAFPAITSSEEKAK